MPKPFEAPSHFDLYAGDPTTSNGVMDNLYVLLHLPVEDVETLIPNGARLGDTGDNLEGLHPVFIFFTHNKFGEPPEPAHIHYREMLVGVPFVHVDDEAADKGDGGYRGPFTYMPRLYINQDDPRVHGNIVFGYEKLDAKISDDGCGRIEIRTPVDGCLVARARAALVASPQRPDENPAFRRHATLFHQPLLTQAARRSDPDIFWTGKADDFLVSWIDYDFDHPTARITPLEILVEIGPMFTPASFPNGKHVPTGAANAFRVEVRQHVHQPVPFADFDATMLSGGAS